MQKIQINDEDDFENGILKDGRSFKVDVRLCDAMSKDVAAHAANLTKPTKQRLVDQFGNDGLSLNRPGFRKLDGGRPSTQAAWDALNQATEAAYDAYESRQARAWKDAVLEVDDDDEDDIFAAKKAAKSTDCYQDYETHIRDEWRRGNE